MQILGWWSPAVPAAVRGIRDHGIIQRAGWPRRRGISPAGQVLSQLIFRFSSVPFKFFYRCMQFHTPALRQARLSRIRVQFQGIISHCGCGILSHLGKYVSLKADVAVGLLRNNRYSYLLGKYHLKQIVIDSFSCKSTKKIPGMAIAIPPSVYREQYSLPAALIKQRRT
jgi:hypothetical protein